METKTVIGSARTTEGRGDIILTEFTSCGLPCFNCSMVGRLTYTRDFRRKSSAIKEIKKILAHPSNQALWSV